jgi:pimeloyl-ACP methyl ester carboxylesterase
MWIGRIAFAVGLLLLTLPGQTAASTCSFSLGFKALHDLIPDIVGDCIADETHDPTSGDALQQTANGLLVWRKADNWTAFTDGATTWLVGPTGLQSRPNDERFAWEGVEPFYAAPMDIPADPGVLLRSEPFTRAVPSQAQAWRILYTTTDGDGTMAVASAIVLTAAGGPPEPRPVIAWAHATIGVASKCAPSLRDNPWGAVPALEAIVSNGWVLVLPDYVGLGTQGPHPYLVGESEARSVLDAVRAARQLEGLSLEDRAVVWGHSQGGHAAFWTGIVGPSYAPDVEVIGVAAIAPAGDFTGLLAGGSAGAGMGLGQIVSAYLATAYSHYYPDVRFDDIVRPRAREVAREMAALCLAASDLRPLARLVQQLQGESVLEDNLAESPFGERLRENSVHDQIAAPLMVAQGMADDLLPPIVQDRFVEQRCAAGQSIEYRTYAGEGHGSITVTASTFDDDLIQWTQDRLTGVPWPAGCRTIAG